MKNSLSSPVPVLVDMWGFGVSQLWEDKQRQSCWKYIYYHLVYTKHYDIVILFLGVYTKDILILGL